MVLTDNGRDALVDATKHGVAITANSPSEALRSGLSEHFPEPDLPET